jgi:cephalosporin hydroxylase
MAFASLTRALVHEVKTLRGALYRRIARGHEDEQALVREFHRVYFDAASFHMTWRNTRWLGVDILKCPLDLWLYQEILHGLRPAVVVETGTAFGGSALFLASVMDLIGHGRIITIDVDARRGRPEHPRITYLTGSSIDPGMVAEVRAMVGGAAPVMVLLDSDHSRAHVAAELEAYAPLVSRGSYLVVEDTNLNGHPVLPDHGPGPMEAVEAFLPAHPDFSHDPAMDKFLLSFNPRGWLRRR